MYNVEEYIEKCLKSLILQTFKDIEIYAISDGSPDQSEQIAREFAKQDSRIKVFSKENGGYGSVLEFAIQSIQTEYFIICDPDDWLEKDAIEILYNSAVMYQTDITLGNRYFVYIDDVNNKIIDDMPNSYYPKGNVVASGIEKDKYYLFSPTPHAKLFRTNVCKKIHFPKHVSFSDFTLFMLGLNNSHSVMYIDKPLANYLVDRPGNSMTDRRPKVVQDHITVYYSVSDQAQLNNPYLKYRLYKEYLLIMFSHVNNSEKFFKKEILSQMNDIRKEVKRFYKDIVNEVSLTQSEKLKYFFTTHSKLTMMGCVLARWISNNK